MVFLKTDDEIELLRKANLLVSATLVEIAKAIRPGITTRQLDELAEQYIRDNKGQPVFKGYPNPYGHPFPASICTSVNEVVVHGIPNDTPLQEGDIVSVDCGAKLNGFCGDSCYTFCVGNVSNDKKRLLQVTKEALYKGIEQAQQGHRLGDIGYAIQSHCEANGFGVVREFVGHGIGREMHEDPQVPNYGAKGTGETIKNGLCIAIEPMITSGTNALYLLPDKWGVITRDRKPAAHFEHTVAVHHGKVEIMSTFKQIETIERQNN